MMKRYFYFLMKIQCFVLVGFLLSSCADGNSLPVEVLGTRSGGVEIAADGNKIFKQTSTIDLATSDGLYWLIYVRSNKKSLKYTEEIKMSGPSSWSVLGKKDHASTSKFSMVVSDDKSGATINREIDNINGILSGSWRFLKDDPKGPVSIRITIEGKVVSTFNWVLQ